MKFAVIGAGNGGQAIAGYLAMSGQEVNLYNRTPDVIESLKQIGGITLKGVLNGYGIPKLFTTDIKEAINECEIIMIATTAVAHRTLAVKLAKYLKDSQIIILNPGRTGGALEFKQALVTAGCTRRVYIAEAQTLLYACRIISPGIVNIIGIKDFVYISALPSSDTDYVLEKLQPVFPCFAKAESVIRTSLGNVGAVFHPCVLLFNAATIERQHEFYFYRDMTEQVGQFIEQFDTERLNVGKAFGIQLMSVNEWISKSYPTTKGITLCEKMKNNPAYYDIKSPSSIYTRQLMEDIPTGVLPILELGKIVGLKMPLHESMFNMVSALLDIDFMKDGRSLKNLGLAGKTKEEIIDYLTN